jgi:ABC-type iron transport system FetAB ATPase subunit
MEGTHSYVLNIIVTGGLTFEGERFLSSPPEQDRAQADLIKFEPKIFGIKLEGNEIFRRLKRWWRSRKKP